MTFICVPQCMFDKGFQLFVNESTESRTLFISRPITCAVVLTAFDALTFTAVFSISLLEVTCHCPYDSTLHRIEMLEAL